MSDQHVLLSEARNIQLPKKSNALVFVMAEATSPKGLFGTLKGLELLNEPINI
jgi:hypothetical protein